MLHEARMYSYIPALDLARARRFYEDKLGLKPTRVLAGGVRYACADGTAFFLYPTPNAGTSLASQAFWEVADIVQEMAALKARGVVFEQYDMAGKGDGEIYDTGEVRAAWFKDSEGNILVLVQTL